MYLTPDILEEKVMLVKKLIVVAVLAIGLLFALPNGSATEPCPVPLIFDTDMGNDVDDAMALAIIHALESRGECKLLGVTLTKDNVYAIRFVDLLNTFYGRSDIPIGIVDGGVLPGDGKYLKRVATAAENDRLLYAHDLQDRDAAPDSVKLLRRILATQPDGSVVIAQVGFSTNLARLLESPADDVSPLAGKSLVKKKVRLLSAMAGAFAKHLLAQGRKEFNVVRDIPAAQKVFGSWPTPVVISGWEIGAAIKHPGVSMREDYRYVKHHPLVDAYHYYRGLENDQPTYDLTSVLYAVRPERGYFDLSASGRMVVDDDGVTRFHQEDGGPHRYLTVNDEQIARVREAQVMLCSQPPAKD